MRIAAWADAYRGITEDAVGQLSPERLRTTNLYLSVEPYEKGAVIGPALQRIYARQRALLVFVDENPKANFAHRCRYRFYDQKSQRFLYEVRAWFPPWFDEEPKTFRAFYEPVRFRRRPGKFRLVIEPASPPRPPAPPRERYAILFSGSRDRRHLNGLEYCYRMLTERYCFKPANVLVLNYDKSFAAFRSTATKWPDETSPGSTPFKMTLFGAADRPGFQSACQVIGPKVQPNDLVFIFTSGHGNAELANGSIQNPYLTDYKFQHYKAADFCADLGLLGAPQSMLIMMQQCFGGEFIGPVLDAIGNNGTIQARTLSVACASMVESLATDDGKFDCFSCGWITSHLQKDPYGVAPIPPVDLQPNGVIEASESYLYAEKVTSNMDIPAYADYPPSGVVVTAVNAPAALSAPPHPNAADIQMG